MLSSIFLDFFQLFICFYELLWVGIYYYSFLFLFKPMSSLTLFQSFSISSDIIKMLLVNGLNIPPPFIFTRTLPRSFSERYFQDLLDILKLKSYVCVRVWESSESAKHLPDLFRCSKPQ